MLRRRQSVQQRGDAMWAQAAELQPSASAFAVQRGEHQSERMVTMNVGGAVCSHDHEPHPLQGPPEELQKLQGGGIGPVQVVEDDEQRPALGSLTQEAGDAIEQSEPRLSRLQWLEAWQVREERAELRQDLGDVRGADP